MKKLLKWGGIALGGLVLVVALAAGSMILSTNSRINKVYEITPEPFEIRRDAASLALGAHWSEVLCQTCHGADLGGERFFDDPALGYVDAPNLTSGAGGIGNTYSVEDWARALRHGIKSDGTSVFNMPSNDYYYLNDTDLGSIIAYMQTIPPVDRETRAPNLTPAGKIMFAVGAFRSVLYAETIEHDARPDSVPVGMTVEYGAYLVNSTGCKSCHGSSLSGMQPAERGALLAPNLTPGGRLGTWSEDDFARTLRTGIIPSGRELDESMPWKGLRHMTDDEITAVWLYLRALPALGSRQ